jgi:hypothetical protein
MMPLDAMASFRTTTLITIRFFHITHQTRTFFGGYKSPQTGPIYPLVAKSLE